MTFAEKFCAQHEVHPADFEATVLKLTLRPVAGFLRPLLNLNPDYFAADRQFIRGVGRIARIEEYAGEEEDFIHDPANRHFFHRTLHLRVSRRRLRKLVSSTLAP